jgi:hypothetical protein
MIYSDAGATRVRVCSNSRNTPLRGANVGFNSTTGERNLRMVATNICSVIPNQLRLISARLVVGARTAGLNSNMCENSVGGATRLSAARRSARMSALINRAAECPTSMPAFFASTRYDWGDCGDDDADADASTVVSAVSDTLAVGLLPHIQLSQLLIFDKYYRILYTIPYTIILGII